MKQVLQYPKKGHLTLEEIPSPALKRGGIVVRTVASLVSAGTEKAMIELAEKSLLGKAKERPDLVRQVIDKVRTEGLMTTYNKVRTRLEAPIALGYSCAGVVTEVAADVSDYKVGDRVAAAGFGYASHAEVIFVPKNLTAAIPANVSHEEAAFVTLGAIALQGVRQANPTLGERVAVMGLGLLGQLTAQILRANGCIVVGMDIDPHKLTLGSSLGCDHTVNNSGETAVSEVMSLTGGIGVDRVVVTAASASPALMSQAAEICRDRGHITIVGAVNMELDRRPFYNKELSLNLSRSYGPGRYDTQYEEKGLDYPIGYVRWTERRNMECFLALVSSGRVNVKGLITHRIDFADATTAYDVIMARTAEPFLGVVLQYPQLAQLDMAPRVLRTAPTRNIQNCAGMVLGALGAGNFSSGVLYPILKKTPGVTLSQVVSPNGLRAISAAKQFGFQKAGTSYEAMLMDTSITAILLATPHHTHASQVVKALNAGKDVFVEKPLATNAEELAQVMTAQARSEKKLMTGFNRRFSPAALAVKKHLAQMVGPTVINYRINAGFIPRENPLQDPDSGKGRIIGEVCHFVDLALYLTDATPTSTYITGMTDTHGKYLSSDNIHATIAFADGSTAVITYVACGGDGLAKERLEAHSGGVSFVIDDFTSATMFRDGRTKTLYRGKQDKGHQAELQAFVHSATCDQAMATALQDAYCATQVTFDMIKSLSTGRAVIYRTPLAEETTSAHTGVNNRESSELAISN